MNRLKFYTIFAVIISGIIYSPAIAFYLTNSCTNMIYVISAFGGLGAGVALALTLKLIKDRASKV